MSNRIVAIIEARMTSSRLPGKVLMPAKGIPMLAHLVQRLQQAPSIKHIVLATTVNSTDDVLVTFAKEYKIDCYRGSEADVLARVIDAADHGKADIVVEITGDCPIIDPQIVEQSIRMFQNNQCDYLGNAHVRSYPDGMDVQVYRLETLKKSAAMTEEPADREHVTLHIRNHPEIFCPLHLVSSPDLHWPDLRLTLDNKTDYELLKRIIEYFPNNAFTCGDVVHLLRNNKSWLQAKDAK